MGVSISLPAFDCLLSLRGSKNLGYPLLGKCREPRTQRCAGPSESLARRTDRLNRMSFVVRRVYSDDVIVMS